MRPRPRPRRRLRLTSRRNRAQDASELLPWLTPGPAPCLGRAHGRRRHRPNVAWGRPMLVGCRCRPWQAAAEVCDARSPSPAAGRRSLAQQLGTGRPPGPPRTARLKMASAVHGGLHQLSVSRAMPPLEASVAARSVQQAVCRRLAGGARRGRRAGRGVGAQQPAMPRPVGKCALAT